MSMCFISKVMVTVQNRSITIESIYNERKLCGRKNAASKGRANFSLTNDTYLHCQHLLVLLHQRTNKKVTIK